MCAWASIVVPSSMITSFSIIANGPIHTFLPNWALGSIIELDEIKLFILNSPIYYRS